jgi:hypothetical protein
MSDYIAVMTDFIAQCFDNLKELESANIDHYTVEQLKVHHDVVCGLYLTIIQFQREVIESLCGGPGSSSLSSSTDETGSTLPPTDA